MIRSLHLRKPALAVTEALAKRWWEGAARGLWSNTHQRWVQPGQAAQDLAQLWFSVQGDGDPPPLGPLSQSVTTLVVKMCSQSLVLMQLMPSAPRRARTGEEKRACSLCDTEQWLYLRPLSSCHDCPGSVSGRQQLCPGAQAGREPEGAWPIPSVWEVALGWWGLRCHGPSPALLRGGISGTAVLCFSCVGTAWGTGTGELVSLVAR